MFRIVTPLSLLVCLATQLLAQNVSGRLDVHSESGARLTAISSSNSRLFKNFDWGPEESRSSHLVCETELMKVGDAVQWQTSSFTFESSEKGEIMLDFKASHNKTEGKKELNMARVFIANVAAEGAVLKNGDFSIKKDGEPESWICSPGVEFATDPNGVSVPIIWHNAPIRQAIAVTADTPITVTFMAQYADFHEAAE